MGAYPIGWHPFTLPTYLIGTLAAFWMFERLAGL